MNGETFKNLFGRMLTTLKFQENGNASVLFTRLKQVILLQQRFREVVVQRYNVLATSTYSLTFYLVLRHDTENVAPLISTNLNNGGRSTFKM